MAPADPGGLQVPLWQLSETSEDGLALLHQPLQGDPFGAHRWVLWM